jgi:pyruvate/2-oxoglutarate/acetoin dehydrogenase E1 component
MEYLKETKKAMEWLGRKKETIFLGQTVVYKGSPMFNSCENIPASKKIEMPVAEDMQMGISIGMALEGFIPISIYPRIDFLLCAINQLVNHLDKVKLMSHNEFNPGVIIRTQIGNTKPLNPGAQHCGDYTEGLRKMCKNIAVIKLRESEDIMKWYKIAYCNALDGISTLLIETPQGGIKPR